MKREGAPPSNRMINSTRVNPQRRNSSLGIIQRKYNNNNGSTVVLKGKPKEQPLIETQTDTTNNTKPNESQTEKKNKRNSN